MTRFDYRPPSEALTDAADRLESLLGSIDADLEAAGGGWPQLAGVWLGDPADDYIATLGPQVGRALVDLFRSAARDVHEVGPDYLVVRVARAVLGESVAETNQTPAPGGSS